MASLSIGSEPSYNTLSEEISPSSFRDSSMHMQQVVRAPPQGMGFTAASLDPPSQMLYQGLNAAHMSGVDLTVQIDQAGQELVQGVQGKFVSLKGNMTYNELLTGLLGKDEHIVSTEPHLQYSSMVVADENGAPGETRVGGRALLTDKRLLLLSSEYSHKSSLTKFGDPKKLPGGYTMEMSCSDSTFYFPISLRMMRSIQMEGRTGISGSISVHATKPPMSGWFGCCGCLKSWTRMPMSYSEYNEMKLTLGLLLPPWNRQTFLELHIPAIVPVHYTRDFVSWMQTLSKELV